MADKIGAVREAVGEGSIEVRKELRVREGVCFSVLFSDLLSDILSLRMHGIGGCELGFGGCLFL